jgi:hypothetical protein
MRTREKLKTIEKEVCALEFTIACLEELKKGFVEEANEISKDAKTKKKVVKKSVKTEKKSVKKAEKKAVKKTKRSK